MRNINKARPGRNSGLMKVGQQNILDGRRKFSQNPWIRYCYLYTDLTSHNISFTTLYL